MEEKRAELTEKILLLFLLYGIRSLSMDDISKQLKISKKTIYIFFSNKAELIEFVLALLLSKIKDDLVAWKSGRNKIAIDQVLNLYHKAIKEREGISEIFLFDLRKYYPEFFTKWSNEIGDVLKLEIYRVIEQGIEQGVFRDDLSLDVSSSYISENIYNIICGEHFECECLDDIVDMNIRSIISLKGNEYYMQKNKKGFYRKII